MYLTMQWLIGSPLLPNDLLGTNQHSNDWRCTRQSKWRTSTIVVVQPMSLGVFLSTIRKLRKPWSEQQITRMVRSHWNGCDESSGSDDSLNLKWNYVNHQFRRHILHTQTKLEREKKNERSPEKPWWFRKKTKKRHVYFRFILRAHKHSNR